MRIGLAYCIATLCNNSVKILQANTEPVLAYYRAKGILRDFQGTESKKIWPHVESFLRSID